jgi:hypothetical protein
MNPIDSNEIFLDGIICGLRILDFLMMQKIVYCQESEEKKTFVFL